MVNPLTRHYLQGPHQTCLQDTRGLKLSLSDHLLYRFFLKFRVILGIFVGLLILTHSSSQDLLIFPVQFRLVCWVGYSEAPLRSIEP